MGKNQKPGQIRDNKSNSGQLPAKAITNQAKSNQQKQKAGTNLETIPRFTKNRASETQTKTKHVMTNNST